MWPARTGWIVLGVAVALLLLAPPDASWAWALDALRSLPPGAAAVVGVAAALAALPAVLGLRSRVAWAAVALGVPLALAFAWPERIHVLGDTQLRQRAIMAFSDHMVPATLADWARRLHAQPLDVLVDVFVPVGLRRSGVSGAHAIAWIGAALGAAWFAGAGRLARRLDAPADARMALALAVALSGTLQVFAGYAESGALLAVTAIWWWAELLAPLDRPRAALRVVAAWLVMLLGHRAALAMLLPQVVRAVAPPLERDTPAGRRALLAGTVVVMAGLAAIAALTGAGRQVADDLRELIATARLGEALRRAPWDAVNVLVLTAPLALLATVLAGREALATAARSPRLLLVAAAALPLLVALVWLFPAGGGGLGLHRDWDAGILLGLALTVGAADVLARLPSTRLRAALAAALPVLTLVGLSWVAVNADEPAALRRVDAMFASRPPLPAAQLSHLHLWAGQRAMDHRRFAEAARHYDEAFRLVANPRRALLAVEAWILAADPAAARRSLARARATGRVPPDLEQGARVMEGYIESLERDAVRAADSTVTSPAAR